MQLLASLTKAVNDAIQVLKQHVEAELQFFRDEVESLTTRVLKLEEDAAQKYKVGLPFEINDSSVEGGEETVKSKKNVPISYASAAAQDQLLQLHSQVQSLSSKQLQLEQEKERDKRKCNVLLGNLREGENEHEDELNEKILEVFSTQLKIKLQPMQTVRVGKKLSGKDRLVLIKMKSFKDKLDVLRAAKSLKSTGMFIMEDLSKSDHEHRKVLVKAMKKARSEGKRAFIRFSDGKLVINGAVVDCTSVTLSQDQSTKSQ